MGKMADRLKEAMRLRGRTVKDIVAAKVMSRANVYLILNGTTRADAIRSDTVEKLARFLQVSQVWLTNGRGPMEIAEFRPASQSAGPDPSILHEALTLLLFDIEHGGPRPARSASDLLMDLYRRIEAAGGRLPPDQERAFERAALARNQQRQGESDGIVQPARGRGKQ